MGHAYTKGGEMGWEDGGRRGRFEFLVKIDARLGIGF